MLMKLKGAFLVLSIAVVVGTFLSKSAHAECKEGEERTTTTGAIFTCDTSHPSLGEAWRDPSGLIWGDIVKKADGTVDSMNGWGASGYCVGIFAWVPTRNEFIRLRGYMGARSGTYEGYSHHDDRILPNLSSYWFWANSDFPVSGYEAYYFNGSSGDFDEYFSGINISTRCIVGRYPQRPK